jgi:hypothetical protein
VGVKKDKLGVALAVVFVLGVIGVIVLIYGPFRRSEPAVVAQTTVTAQLDDTPSAAQHSYGDLQQGRSKLLSPKKLFETSSDLKAAAAELQKQAASNGDAAYFAARSLEECLTYSADPERYEAGFNSRRDSRSAAASVDFQRAVRSHIDRCRAFNQKEIHRSDIDSLYQQASAAGNQAAVARQVLREVVGLNASNSTNEEQHERVTIVKASKDPYAIAQLADAMGEIAQGKQDIFGEFSGRPSDVYAWQLAACTIGLPCGSGSALLNGFCLQMNVCGTDSVESAIQTGLLSPTEFEQVETESRAIVAHLNSMQ